MDDAEEIAGRLRELRQEAGMTVADWADSIGERPSRVTDVERGKQRPPTPMLIAVCQKHRVSSTWLLSGAGPKHSDSKPKNIEAALNALQFVTVKIGAIDVEDHVKRAAQEWALAIEMRDADALRSLTQRYSATPAVAEPAAAYGAKVNVENLAEAVALVDETLGSGGASMSPQRRAKLIAAVYSLGGNPDREVVRQLVSAAVF